MQPRTPLFDATISQSHRILVRADVLRNGKPLETGLPVVSGSVTGDRSQFARRTCSVVIGDPSLKPTGMPSDLLAPYGNEIRLWRGAVTPAGDELIPVGTFGIRSAVYDAGGAYAGITITGTDRSKRISDARFPYPQQGGNKLGVLQIEQLLVEAVPWCTIRVDPYVRDAYVPSVTWSTGRDTAVTDLATSIGAEVFCDPLGEFVIQPIPSPWDAPVYTVAVGGSSGVLVSAQRSLSRDGVFNGIIARAQSTGQASAPVSDLMVDTDPTSPTFWSTSGFGQVVGFFDSSLLTTRDQCNNAATGQLANMIGAARSITFTALVNPALEPGDIVQITDPETGLGENHLLDTVTMPLTAKDPLQAQSRSTLTRNRRHRFAYPPGSLG